METQPRQYSMVWIAWCMKISAKSRCCRDGAGGGTRDIGMGWGGGEGGTVTPTPPPEPTGGGRAPHLGVGAVPPALHVLLGGVDGVAGLLPLQQRLFVPGGHRLHGDGTDSET